MVYKKALNLSVTFLLIFILTGCSSTRKNVEQILFGGGNNNILIHTGQAINYINSGILEETLVHEASHTSLDSYHSSNAGWLNAQIQDNQYISTYAQDYPQREDIAESFLVFLAVQHRSDRISDDTYRTIVQTIPNRIKYFNSQECDMYPIVINEVE